MTISTTGTVVQNNVTGEHEVGVGPSVTGTLTVNGGDTLAMIASAGGVQDGTEDGVEPSLDVGSGTNANGTVTVTGSNSKIRLLGEGERIFNGDGVDGVTVAIGEDGGTGALNVLAGATFEIVDTSTTFMDDATYFGAEQMFVGLGEGSTGTVLVSGSGSTLAITGGAPTFEVGRDGGTGSALFDNGAAFTLHSVTENDLANQGNPDIFWRTSEPFLTVGRRDGGVGVITFDHSSTGTVTSGDNSGITVEVGRDTGVGTFNLLGGSTFTTNGDAWSDFVVGRGGATGFLNIAGASHLDIIGTSENALFRIGALDPYGSRWGAGTGTAVITDSFVDVASDANAQIRIGDGHPWQPSNEPGGDGTLDADNSTLTVSGGGLSSFWVGTNRGTGHVRLDNSSLLQVTGAQGANLTIGKGGGDLFDNPGSGRVDLDNSNIVITGTGTGGADVSIGTDGGFGILNLRDADLSLTSELNTNFNAGLNEGSALIDVSAGSTITMTATGALDSGASVGAKIGGDDGAAIMTLRGGSTWNLVNASGAFLNVGDNSGTGSLYVQGGSHINFQVDPTAGANLQVGGTEGSDAHVFVTGGSVIDMGGSVDTWGGVRIGTNGADSATVLVEGVGSTVDHVSFAQLGYDADDSSTVMGGSGTLTVRNGGVVNADAIHVGAGGSLGGYRGTVNGSHVALVGGGKIDLRDGLFGSFTIHDLLVMDAGNALHLDAGSSGRQDTLVFNEFYDYPPDPHGALTINLNAVGGYQFAVGETRALLALAGDNVPNFSFSVAGQSAHLGFYGGRLASDPDTIYFKALNAGNSTAANLAILDFGTDPLNPAATVSYNSVSNTGAVKGGIFGSEGGKATNIDKFLGTNLNDVMTVTGATPRVLYFDGRSGNDTVNGGAGVDTILGNIGIDTLNGNAGNDILNGGNDNDTLFGGVGKDTNTGGAGNDTFKFTATNQSTVGANADIITDFDDLSNDTINLSAVYGGTLAYRHNLAFTAAGQVRINDIAGADVIVQVNTGGSLAADMEIRLTNTTLASMAANDFVL